MKLKTIIIFIGCLLFRLLPFRAPNLEPIMSSIMPIGKKNSILSSFLFGFLSIFVYDLLTHFGSWTFIAGITYGLVGVAAVYYFRNQDTRTSNFVWFAFLATIFFDLVTGVLFAPLFGQTMLTALALQIPFTLIHLAGNIGFALTLSPMLNKWLKQDVILSVGEYKLKESKI